MYDIIFTIDCVVGPYVFELYNVLFKCSRQ